MRRVPREDFVLSADRDAAYEDHPLGIGYGQTISQPFIVALMLQALTLKSTDSVLEVGTGSGYVAAILGELVERVTTVEIVPELALTATRTLHSKGYSNIDVHLVPRSTLGWIDNAPYDAIIVSAGAPSIPPILSGQLKWNGRMVIPVGSRSQQELIKLTRTMQGDKVESLGSCYFVPLIGDDAWKS
ncbi:MAG: protein-L-isoaspartate(D-aspartate) O-methyltransferase [Dehalococcoidia bacterium]|nr:protein-L-isoaspartate(D-aspartate) O-methyltransferase [Dehalococcoidia bacterium]